MLAGKLATDRRHSFHDAKPSFLRGRCWAIKVGELMRFTAMTSFQTNGRRS